MKLKIAPSQLDWWFWAITSVFITSALLGWVPGYYFVMALSVAQVLFFGLRTRSLRDFDTQVRIVYLALTLGGLLQAIRLPLFILLLPGTLLVVFFNRCTIAIALKRMPWNQGAVVQIHSRPSAR